MTTLFCILVLLLIIGVHFASAFVDGLNDGKRRAAKEAAKEAGPRFKLATTLPEPSPVNTSSDPFDMFAADPAPVMEPAISAVAPSRAPTAVDLRVPAYVRKGVKLSF